MAAIISARLSSLRVLLAAAAAVLACLVAPADAFATLPSRGVLKSPSISAHHNSCQKHNPSRIVRYNDHADAAVRPRSIGVPSPRLSNNDDDAVEDISASSTGNTFYTPLDRPLLAAIDAVALVIFAAIGKSSHSADGSLDPLAVLVTAFPFVTAWLATSPLTGVYSPDDRGENMLSSTALKVGRGWILAVPLGIALRGAIRGYVPPVPFVIVTLVSTLVILAGVRILFSVLEDFFVELVN